MSADQIGLFLAAVLTVAVFSYLLGHNPLYRLTQHLFIGVSLGYVGVVVLTTVLLPRLGAVTGKLGSDPTGALLGAVPLVLGVLLLWRAVRPTSGAGTVGLNIVTVTAAGLAVGGVLAGTLLPQMLATMLALNPTQPLALLNNLIIIAGVLASLYYFSFGVRPNGQRSSTGALVAGAGRWLIIGTLGAVLGLLIVSFVSALLERLTFLLGLAGL